MLLPAKDLCRPPMKRLRVVVVGGWEQKVTAGNQGCALVGSGREEEVVAIVERAVARKASCWRLMGAEGEGHGCGQRGLWLWPLVSEDADPSESLEGSLAKASEVYDEASGIQCGVSAQELTRKLNQLLEMRQQEGIAELESSFDHTGYSNGDLAENLSDNNGEVTEINEEESGNYYRVSAQELERRLHELLETRQQERIAELESALDCAERKLREKEREICWWRDTASLVSQHKNEELNR
ncbi:hypothetical protein GW17_00048517 [Ensete ventricosum]|nr:hypothetical protein GW17_00048517 [Ensete ventricosum]RZS19375.1 hypothetical protein BHM03_00051791 [Ensete ventricosum]